MRPDPKSGEAVNVKSKEKETLCFLPVYFRTSCFMDEGKITSKPVYGLIPFTQNSFFQKSTPVEFEGRPKSMGE